MRSVLSQAEFEIAERIALGQSKKEVAYDTNRSVYTVETTVKHIYEKLGFSKVSDLVLWYCGVSFKINAEIAKKKREILASFLIAVFAMSQFYSDDSFCRINRSRRRDESECIIEK